MNRGNNTAVAVLSLEDLLGGNKVLKKPLRTYEDQIFLIEQGLPIAALRNFIREISITMDDIATFLHVSKRTLERNARLSTPASDQLLRIAELYAKGYEVFESEDVFKNWMDSNNQALGGKTPKEMLSTSVGRQMIYEVLGRIQYGVYS